MTTAAAAEQPPPPQQQELSQAKEVPMAVEGTCTRDAAVLEAAAAAAAETVVVPDKAIDQHKSPTKMKEAKRRDTKPAQGSSLHQWFRPQQAAATAVDVTSERVVLDAEDGGTKETVDLLDTSETPVAGGAPTPTTPTKPAVPSPHAEEVKKRSPSGSSTMRSSHTKKIDPKTVERQSAMMQRFFTAGASSGASGSSTGGASGGTKLVPLEQEMLASLEDDLAQKPHPSNQTDFVVLFAFLMQFKDVLSSLPGVKRNQPLFPPTLLERAILDDPDDVDHLALRQFLNDFLEGLLAKHRGRKEQQWFPLVRTTISKRIEQQCYDDADLPAVSALAAAEDLWSLPWPQRLRLVKELCDWLIADHTSIREHADHLMTTSQDKINTLIQEPFASDRLKRQYWHFGDSHRIWRSQRSAEDQIVWRPLTDTLADVETLLSDLARTDPRQINLRKKVREILDLLVIKDTEAEQRKQRAAEKAAKEAKKAMLASLGSDRSERTRRRSSRHHNDRANYAVDLEDSEHSSDESDAGNSRRKRRLKQKSVAESEDAIKTTDALEEEEEVLLSGEGEAYEDTADDRSGSEEEEDNEDEGKRAVTKQSGRAVRSSVNHVQDSDDDDNAETNANAEAHDEENRKENEDHADVGGRRTRGKRVDYTLLTPKDLNQLARKDDAAAKIALKQKAKKAAAAAMRAKLAARNAPDTPETPAHDEEATAEPDDAVSIAEESEESDEEALHKYALHI